MRIHFSELTRGYLGTCQFKQIVVQNRMYKVKLRNLAVLEKRRCTVFWGQDDHSWGNPGHGMLTTFSQSNRVTNPGNQTVLFIGKIYCLEKFLNWHPSSCLVLSLASVSTSLFENQIIWATQRRSLFQPSGNLKLCYRFFGLMRNPKIITLASCI